MSVRVLNAAFVSPETFTNPAKYHPQEMNTCQGAPRKAPPYGPSAVPVIDFMWMLFAGFVNVKPSPMRVVHLGRSTCHAVSGQGS